MPVLSAAATTLCADIAALLRAAPARAGRHRVLAIEGRSGAGKSWLADLLANRLAAPVLRMDDLYPGWDGLAASPPLARRWIIEPLLAGSAPRWRRYDWERGEPGAWEHTPVAGTLLIEGCGSGATELRAHLSLLVWVDAPPPVRAERLARRFDAAVYSPYHELWRRQEDAFYARHRVRDHADVIVDNAAAAG
ncbi:nucleoside/nucleotide kinase family protein [Marinitenerispora sediminis]|uniref:Uridine kinase n=1 Tax=Marinitenerispora sediminis TaxID=1931232 RepID=A0A368T937_9ACTN|nr:hypothetical protein [Marinitenerispora sediminis]RCV52370.1 hypothetical protein DEF28_13170 [Marinitenerispora sediminis]RCV60935.1 hypothetical protein DEF24_05580 [Marinitenerispora sediminis]RCV62226.1 hypothetical protein DEF23_00540 [Marinitenerispora sediminis]